MIHSHELRPVSQPMKPLRASQSKTDAGSDFARMFGSESSQKQHKLVSEHSSDANLQLTRDTGVGRNTLINFGNANTEQKEKAKKYAGLYCCKVRVKPRLHPEVYMKSNYEIDQETRNSLDSKEQWHFCVFQLGFFAIIVFMTSLFELLIFIVAFFANDMPEQKLGQPFWDFMKKFQFICESEHGQNTVWNVDYSSLSMTLFKLHFIVIFMYTSISTIVLYTIPYRFDRIKKTRQEKKAEQ